MSFVTISRSARGFFRSLYLHFFLLGGMTCMLFWFRTESAYETELFNNINEKMLSGMPPHPSRDSFALAALHMTHYLQERRLLVFGEQPFNSFKFKYIHPATVDLMTGNGACGSYTLVLGRILKANNMQIRFGQMEVNERPAGHIFLETLTESGWIVLDGLYDLVFIRPDGRFATYEDVHNNWAYYQQQVPAGYDSSFSYQNVRYTNWNKFSFLTRGAKWVLNMLLGKERADKISLRSYFLRIYDKLFWGLLVLYILLTLRTWHLVRLKQAQNSK